MNIRSDLYLFQLPDYFVMIRDSYLLFLSLCYRMVTIFLTATDSIPIIGVGLGGMLVNEHPAQK